MGKTYRGVKHGLRRKEETEREEIMRHMHGRDIIPRDEMANALREVHEIIDRQRSGKWNR